MDNIKHSRFKDAEWYNSEAQQLLIGGAGGISSWTVLLLTRAGFECVVYDFDLYEEHNMSGQFVKSSDVGLPKVDALHQNCIDFTGEGIIAMNEKFTSESMSNPIMIGGFDNMVARKEFFEKWLEGVKEAAPEEKKNYLFIDGRLLAEQYQVFSFTGDNELVIKNYQKEHLFGDEEVEDAMCTLKQTSHVAAIIAGRITSFVTNHIVNIKREKKARTIPFFYEEFTPLCMREIILKVEENV